MARFKKKTENAIPERPHIYLVRSVVIKKGHELYPEIDALCFRAKNLYNSTLYHFRQNIFENQKKYEQAKLDAEMHGIPFDKKSIKQEYIKWNVLSGEFAASKQQDYVGIGNTKISQSIMRHVGSMISTYYKSLVAYWKSNDPNYKMPKPPGYLHKTEGRSLVLMNEQCFDAKLLKKGILKSSLLSKPIDFKMEFLENETKFQEVRIVPKNGYYKIEVVYKKYIYPELNPDENGELFTAGIDLGIGIFAAIATTSGRGYLIRGNQIKHINKIYNELIADAKSKLPQGVYTSKKIQALWRRRDAKIKHFMHHASKILVDTLYNEHVSQIVIGKNKNWKQNTNIGKKNNKDFVQIPHAVFIDMVAYKAAMRGLSVVTTEEAYTSKASALDKDQLFSYGNKPAEHMFSGKRTNRGLYISKDGFQCHADVNGAFNIMRKHDTMVDMIHDYPTVVFGCVVCPEVIFK